MVTFGRGRFRPILELGRGGMSRVFLCVAHDAGPTRRLVVVKTLLPDYATDPEFLAMFLEEARLSSRLNHPNVIQVLEVWAPDVSGHASEEDEPFMVMEYLDGQSLESIARRAKSRGGFPLDLQLRALVEVARGVHHAHELKDVDGRPMKLVHRDLSPHNVFVTYQGQVKVLDFGIARAADTQGRTGTGILKGKSAYMAPEQLRGSKYLDRRSDVFALGVMLWQALTRRRLWAGMSDLEIFQRLGEHMIPSPLTVDPTLDPTLVRLVLHAMAPERDARLGSAAELADGLEAWLADRGSPAKARDCGAFTEKLFAERRQKIAALVKASMEREPSSSDLLGLDAFSPNSSAEMRVDSLGLRVGAAYSGAWGTQTPEPGPVSERRQDTPAVAARGSVARHADRAPLRDARPEATFGATTSSTHRTRRATGASPAIVLTAVGLLCLSLLGAAFLVAGSRADEVTGSGGSGAPPPAVGESREPATTTSLVVTAFPPEARIVVDGLPLVGNPARARLPRDGRRHEIRAEATGYEGSSQWVELQGPSQTVTLSLVRR